MAEMIKEAVVHRVEWEHVEERNARDKLDLPILHKMGTLISKYKGSPSPKGKGWFGVRGASKSIGNDIIDNPVYSGVTDKHKRTTSFKIKGFRVDSTSFY